MVEITQPWKANLNPACPSLQPAPQGGVDYVDTTNNRLCLIYAIYVSISLVHLEG